MSSMKENTRVSLNTLAVGKKWLVRTKSHPNSLPGYTIERREDGLYLYGYGYPQAGHKLRAIGYGETSLLVCL